LAGWISRKFSAPLYMSRSEYLMCRVLVGDTGREAPEEGMDLYRGAGFTKIQLDSYAERFGGFGRAVSKLPDNYRRLRDKEIIKIGKYTWEVVVGSGHCPEHVCLYSKELKLLISGDQVLPKISSNVSVFPTEPLSNPLEDWLDSCHSIKERVPNNVLILPAHNEPFRGLHERLDNLINGHERNLERLLELCKEPKRAIDVFSVLFKRTISDDVLLMATGESIAHLNCLLMRNLINTDKDKNGVIYYKKVL
jgi:glyoxylase-like metal-dependent hydrolase (beta-lactamase superfamily II)